MDLLKRRLMMLPLVEPYIQFADPIVAEICNTNFGDGTGVTKRMAGKITDAQLASAFNASQQKTSITSFDEFKYFTSVTKSGVWNGCSLLKSITLPKTCLTLEQLAFNDCTSLERINLEGIRYMYRRAFRNCISLRIDVSMPNLIDISGTVGTEHEVFRESGITKVLNFGMVRDVGTYSSFGDCPNLTEVWLPATIVRMSRFSFYNCPSLARFVILAVEPPELMTDNIIGGSSSRKIYVPYSADHSILDSYKTADRWTAYANAIFELNQDGTIPQNE